MVWIKSLHIFAVLAWMAAVFYLPRLLVNVAEAHAAGEPLERLLGMVRRLYRFGHMLGGTAILLGLWTWQAQGYTGPWIFWKLALVAVLFAYYVVCGRFGARMARGIFPHSSKFYRILNEVSVFLVLPIVFLAVVKPG